MTDPTLYGFYSAEMASRYGTTVYQTPSGEEVVVTEVTPKQTPSNWNDVQFVGIVTHYVRADRTPLFKHDLDYLRSLWHRPKPR